MISESRAREIDTYFYRDHKARGRHFFITTGVGTIVVTLCRFIFGLAENVSFAIAGIAVVLTLLSLLAIYHPQTSWAPTRTKTGAQEPVVTDFMHSMVYGMNRRALFARMSLFALAGVCLAILPKRSVAEAVNARIRRLLLSGRDSEAQGTALEAIESNIPLDPDVVQAAPRKLISASQAEKSPIVPVPRGGAPHYVVVQLAGAERITISLPILYLNAGRWPTSGLYGDEYSTSIIGAGADRAYLVLSSVIPADTAAVVHSAHQENMLLFGFTVLPENTFRVGEPAFLGVRPGSSWAAVSNVVVQSLRQSLDRAIWQETKFVECDIYCGGDRFRLTKVTFTGCTFSFAEGFPADVKARLGNNQGRPLSMDFLPLGSSSLLR